VELGEYGRGEVRKEERELNLPAQLEGKKRSSTVTFELPGEEFAKKGGSKKKNREKTLGRKGERGLQRGSNRFSREVFMHYRLSLARLTESNEDEMTLHNNTEGESPGAHA